MSTPALSRRRALVGVAGVGVGLPVLVACGSDATSTAGSTSTPSSTPTSAAASPSAPATSAEASTSAAPATGFATTTDIPVGGGKIFADEEVVVTQPTAGEFKCFSSICTHQGCPVTKVTTTIDCTCHGSEFSLTDGSPTAGPASDPLPAVDVVVTGDQISLA